jgi:hypothetical protein
MPVLTLGDLLMYTPIHEKIKVKKYLLTIRRRWTKHFYKKYLTAPTLELREAYEERLHHHTKRRIQLEKEIEGLTKYMNKMMEIYK